jgi:voltage-gated potassium channel
LNASLVSAAERPPEKTRESLIQRRVRRIVNARSVTIGLAGTFVGLALVGALLMRIADPHNFPTVGLAIWWAIQTVTTVGYGDVVPTTDAGRILGGLEMVIGVAFIAFVTAGVTSTVIQRAEAQAQEADRERDERNTRQIIDSLTETKSALLEIAQRLNAIDSQSTD